MLAHYTVAHKLRSDPNRATIVYANRVREAFPGVPVILGGIEASLRRLAHYDYWQDKIRRSILLDAKADLLVYGMGETQITAIARRLAAGESLDTITDIPGTVYERPASSPPHTVGILPQYSELPPDAVTLPSYEECAGDTAKSAEAFKLTYEQQDPYRGKTLIQPHGNRIVVQNPPPAPLSTAQLDRLYELPFERRWHPAYDQAGGVPALETVRFSIVSHRGCYGDCSFCALTFHQGRIIQSRSIESIVREVKQLQKLPEWRGVISDIGGPTANMYGTGCKRGPQGCGRRECLKDKPCPSLNVDSTPLIKLLCAVRAVPGVRKVFTGSGIRFDLCLADNRDLYLAELCEHHISGRLKVAPEHISGRVLRLMNKPGVEVFDEFRRRFDRINRNLGKRQYLVSYFMSSHPGCGTDDMCELVDYLRRKRMQVEQVQDFYPCPMTLSSCIYHTGIHPLTGEHVFVAKTDRDKQTQRHMLNTPKKKYKV